MLKRYQVLLNDWLAESVKDITDAYDLSFSEGVRLGLCMYYSAMITEMYPEHKFEFTPKKIAAIIGKYSKTSHHEEEMHRTISNIYYESRKTMEFFQKQKEKKEKPVS